MPIQENLCPKGEMETDANRQMSPLRIKNMKPVLFDKGIASHQIHYFAFLVALHLPDGGRKTTHQDQKDPLKVRLLR